MSDTVHTYPAGDYIDHDTGGGDCICGPTTIPVQREDGSYGWNVVHHSLDGREQIEQGRDDLPHCALCKTIIPPGGSIHDHYCPVEAALGGEGF